jgi:hypothetical protein
MFMVIADEHFVLIVVPGNVGHQQSARASNTASGDNDAYSCIHA